MATNMEFYIPDKTRKNTIKEFSKFFSNGQCKEVERGVYEYTQQFCISMNNMIMSQSVYDDVVSNLKFNFESENETISKIIKLINKKKYNAYNLAFLRPEEMNEENWEKILLRRKTTEEKLNNLPTIEWKQCKSCKCIKYYYYQLQTRSADEPMTTFYICESCGKTYRVNN